MDGFLNGKHYKVTVDTNRLITWMNEKWADQACPICKHLTWNVDDCIYRLDQVRAPQAKSTGSRIRFAVPVTCKNCGYVVLFDALLTKLLIFQPVEEDNNGQ